MKKQTMITLALALTLAMPAMPAFAQKAMSKKEFAEKEKAFKNLQHPWKGKKVAYFGDSITDPRIKASKVKYWGFLQDWLGITPYVYGVSGRQWNDIPRQADLLQKEHGDDFDAILIFMGTNDYNNGVPIGEWYTETFDSVRVALHKPSEMVQRRHGQEYPERSHQHCHVEVEADVSYQANCGDDSYPSCLLWRQRQEHPAR